MVSRQVLHACYHRQTLLSLIVTLCCVSVSSADEPPGVLAKPGFYEPLTEPPCSYCSTQHRKGLIENSDRVVTWLRGAHNGGAIPVRHFLAGPRVVNDTSGLFFYDPDGGYVAAYKKDYGYRFYGWRRGVMVVQGPDGSLWSALSGIAFEGPREGQRLERVPSMVTDWAYWLMLHPESTAYDLFAGDTYRVVPLPTILSQEGRASMGEVDSRLGMMTNILGVEVNGVRKAYPLDQAGERACFVDTVGERRIAVFWYRPTRTAVAFSADLGERRLSFHADTISPESAPMKDRETGTRWTLAGRGIDGPLRGRELQWVNSIQCRWYAWAAEFPDTEVYGQ